MPKYKQTPVVDAADQGDLATLGALLNAGGDPNEADRMGRTGMLYAAMKNNVAAMRLLLSHGADVNKPDRMGWSPLHAAAQEYALDSLRLLLESGAVVDAQDSHGNTPLSNAVFYSRGRGEAIRALLSAGANRHMINKQGVSPQMLAEAIANYDVKQWMK